MKLLSLTLVPLLPCWSTLRCFPAPCIPSPCMGVGSTMVYTHGVSPDSKRSLLPLAWFGLAPFSGSTKCTPVSSLCTAKGVSWGHSILCPPSPPSQVKFAFLGAIAADETVLLLCRIILLFTKPFQVDDLLSPRMWATRGHHCPDPLPGAWWRGGWGWLLVWALLLPSQQCEGG